MTPNFEGRQAIEQDNKHGECKRGQSMECRDRGRVQEGAPCLDPPGSTHDLGTLNRLSKRAPNGHRIKGTSGLCWLFPNLPCHGL